MELFDHQKKGIEFLKKIKRGILADEMGLGKTRQAIVAAGDESDGTILVICPASLKVNWQREIKMIYPDDMIMIVSGGKPPQPSQMPAWIIINYDILEKHKEWICEAVGSFITTVILDEAHYIKDTSTIRTKATFAITEGALNVYCLTGTPVMNKPIELFPLLRAIKHPLATRPETAPSALRREYSVRYCEGHIRQIYRRGGSSLRFWEEKGATRLPELKELTKEVFLRRTKKEVLNLPEKIVSVVECEMDKEYQRAYDGAWDEYIDFIAANPLEKDIDNIINAQSLVELIKLKQVCSQAKISRIASDIENAVEQGQKVIVFSQFTATIEAMMAELSSKKIKAVSLTGQNDMDERQKAVDDFQNKEDVKAFVANIKAGGVGITLTAASIVIFADMDWSPEVHNQAMDRAHRIGQTGTVNVYYYLITGTIEEDIIDLLMKKQETIGTLTGADTTIPAFMDMIVRRIKGNMSTTLSTKTGIA